MGKQRGHNEGTISKRADGRWMARLTLPGGKRKAFYGKTRQEVAKRLAEASRDRDKGLPIVSERLTVGQFLTQWLEIAKPTIRAGTFVRYEEYVRLHTLPIIGNIRLARLTPQDLNGLYAKKQEAGLSPTSVRHLHAVLHLALGKALRWGGLVATNVAEAADPPRRAHKEIQPLSPDQCRLFLEVAKDDRYEALYVVALTTGMRLGEILGLHWRDVDLDQGTIQVRIALPQKGGFSEPKTAKGRRQITLPAMTIDTLRRHRVKQLEERLSAGPLWEDKDLVFTNALGNPADQTNLRYRSFRPLLKKAGLPQIRFHDLRHSAATLLLSMGIHPKVVQELLGHSSIAVTMDIYSHAMPTLQKEAMAGMDRLLRG